MCQYWGGLHAYNDVLTPDRPSLLIGYDRACASAPTAEDQEVLSSLGKTLGGQKLLLDGLDVLLLEQQWHLLDSPKGDEGHQC
jgi:hypothetical protein